MNENQEKKLTDKDIGIKVVGQVVNCKVNRGTSKEGKAFASTETMLLCGSEIVRIVERHRDNQPEPKQSLAGDIVSINLFAGYKDNGVLVLNGSVQ